MLYAQLIFYPLFNLHLSLYISFLTFSYINILGFLSFIIFLLQISSGILSSIYYNDFFTIAFDSIIYLLININKGWFIRILHVIGASLFILLLMLHLIRSIWIKSKLLYTQCISFTIYITGYLLFILSMIEGFLGYLLCWGQMSYWGITVMINIVAILPCCGIIISELIWSAVWVILNRIFVYHFLIGLLIGLLILIHIIILHSFSSSNPSINNNTLIISFYPFIIKDLYSSFITIFSILCTFLYWEPDSLGNSDNQVIANPLITPNNILPEWYYLLFYSCLRSFPSKIIGIIAVLSILIIIINPALSLNFGFSPLFIILSFIYLSIIYIYYSIVA
uniref:cytochrome b n=1 Tax=Calcarina hispida TaxID=203399 RepID=UPI0023F0803B|nr:cytochrome b [Calcarina hispida]WEF49987.1 cytochrome b [Calcarina hispida]